MLDPFQRVPIIVGVFSWNFLWAHEIFYLAQIWTSDEGFFREPVKTCRTTKFEVYWHFKTILKWNICHIIPNHLRRYLGWWTMLLPFQWQLHAFANITTKIYHFETHSSYNSVNSPLPEVTRIQSHNVDHIEWKCSIIFYLLWCSISRPRISGLCLLVPFRLVLSFIVSDPSFCQPPAEWLSSSFVMVSNLHNNTISCLWMRQR